MKEDEARSRYELLVPRYRKLESIIKPLLIKLLESHHLDYDKVESRIKDFKSFFDKINRFGYRDPFNENEDFCGLRIVHYYDHNTEIVKDLLDGEFHVVKHVDKTEQIVQQHPREFGYRSFHMIVKLKEKHFAGNEELKEMVAEIQVRTICMHAWAAIEHKLGYKQKDMIPPEYRRKFSTASALLEIADELFDQLKNEKERLVNHYVAQLSGISTKDKILDDYLNIDTLHAFLKLHFGKYRTLDRTEKYLLDELNQSSLNLRDISVSEEKLKKMEVVDRILGEYPSKDGPTRSGIVRVILDITNEKFFRMREPRLRGSTWLADWLDFVIRWQKILNYPMRG